MRKENLRTLVALLCLASSAALPLDVTAQQRAQSPATNVAAATSRLNTAPPWQPKARRAHETEWQAVTLVTNPVTRRVRAVTNAYIELATSLNYRDPSTGRWKPSDPAFHITALGAESTAGGHTVLLAPDIGTVGAVTVRKGNLTLQSHPLCVGYYDPVDGRSVRLAEITNSIGWLVNSNEVIYSNCFNGLRASIRIRNSRAGIEQDLLIHEQPEFKPSDVGFSRLTRLELFTEFVGETPVPQVTTRVLRQEPLPEGVAQLRESEFKDSTLDFGGLMRMNPGRAFSTGKRGMQSRARERMDAAIVAKRFENIGTRRILIEAVPVREIEKVLTNLPAATLTGALTNAAIHRSLSAPGGEVASNLSTLNATPTHIPK